MISLVVAYAQNRVIGRQNELPWYLPADLKHFRELTTGNTVIMGRKTFDSITARNGKALPNRQNIIITRQPSFSFDEVFVARSFDEAIKAATNKIYVIGGAQIYDLSLRQASRIYATEVQAEIDGDVFFPELDESWREISREKHTSDEKNIYDYDFVVYERSL